MPCRRCGPRRLHALATTTGTAISSSALLREERGREQHAGGDVVSLARQQQPHPEEREEQRQRVDTRQIEKRAAALEQRRKQPGGEQRAQPAACAPMDQRRDQREDAQRGRERNHSQRQQLQPEQLRDGRRHVIVERRVNVWRELERRRHVERLAGQDARHVFERPSLHPLEVVGVTDARERHDQVRSQVPERARDERRLHRPPPNRNMFVMAHRRLPADHHNTSVAASIRRGMRSAAARCTSRCRRRWRDRSCPSGRARRSPPA